MQPFRLLALILVIIVSASGCVLPPSVQEAQVIREDEFSLIAALSKGKALARAGRLELAELEFRKVIRESPDVTSAYNDLGFTLQGETRYQEALDVYLHALELEPLNAQVMDNVARLYYEMGELEAAKKLYETLLHQLPSGKLTSVPSDTSVWTKNLMLADYQLGFVDEALCLSRSMSGPQNLNQSAQFLRLLLSEGHLGEAVSFADGLVTFFGGTPPPNILLDYGIALYETGNTALAQAAFDRLVATAGATSEDRKSANLFKLDLAVRAQDEREAEYVFQSLLRDEPELCAELDINAFGYWPIASSEKVLATFSERCTNENESSSQAGWRRAIERIFSVNKGRKDPSALTGS